MKYAIQTLTREAEILRGQAKELLRMKADSPEQERDNKWRSQQCDNNAAQCEQAANILNQHTKEK